MLQVAPVGVTEVPPQHGMSCLVTTGAAGCPRTRTTGTTGAVAQAVPRACQSAALTREWRRTREGPTTQWLRQRSRLLSSL